MYITKAQLTELMEEIAPSEGAEGWDNIGWLLHDGREEFKNILLAFDVTPFSARRAVSLGCDLIISHHPLLMEGIKRIDTSTIQGQTLLELIKGGVSVFSAHTNLDAAHGGVNDCFAKVLGLKDVQERGMLRVGVSNEGLTLKEFADKTASALKSESVRFVGDPQKKISTVALCGGSGMSLYEQVLDCDAFITGEIKYDQALCVDALGRAVIVAGHYETEAFVMEFLLETLQERFYRVECNTKINLCEPYKVLRAVEPPGR